MSVFNWFNARAAVEVGVALADQFAPSVVAAPATPQRAARRSPARNSLQELLGHAERDVRAHGLNLYQRARFASSFKWRLLERGVARELAAAVTRRLVVHLLLGRADPAPTASAVAAPSDPRAAGNAEYLLAQGNACIGRRAPAEAVGLYEAALGLNPRHAEALNNLGAALCALGRYAEAERHFREAARVRPDYAEAHSNLGELLRSKGQAVAAEAQLRYALKLNPKLIDARYNLGLTLILRGRLGDARAHFNKALKLAPRHAGACVGIAQVAGLEGHFDEAQAMLARALKIDPDMPAAWAALAGLKRMTATDARWLEHAEAIAAGGIAGLQEADLRFAIGKYCDDVGDFPRAFASYRRANELLKAVAEPYDRDARRQFVDAQIRAYPTEAAGAVGPGASDSTRPIFVVGMLRSGTSLAEQILSAHPAVVGAGELAFWSEAMATHAAALGAGPPGAALRAELAGAYGRALAEHSTDAARIVDKAPQNADYLGIIHSVFPHARIIYMQRDPRDSCLSCYFQQLSTAHNYTLDLADLAHYYREHERLMAHWRAALPPGTLLEVPYAGLVADQPGWTRRMLEFLDLEWHDGCLEFHRSERAVMTASFWQVRQAIYRGSVDRWRNYRKFIGPLLGLRADVAGDRAPQSRRKLA